MLDAYSTTRDKLVQIILQAEDCITSDHQKSLLELNREKLTKNKFCLAIMGQFKRGKTTFINALLGHDLLPTAIIPHTSAITVLQYGDKLSVKVFFNKGLSKEIALSELELYVTEKHNPNNKKGVHHAEIYYPSPYLQNGVQIVDTPGVASMHQHNTEATYQYLPYTDAAVVLVGADPPITKAEFDFLNDLKKEISTIFFIQNKIDAVSIQDQKESLNYTKEVIEKEAGIENIIVYPVSSKSALEGKKQGDHEKVNESGLPAFENVLERFFMHEKGYTVLISTISRVMNIVNQEMLLAQIKQKSLHIPLEELEEKKRALNDMLLKADQERTDSDHILSGEVETLIRDILEADLDTLKNEKTKEILEDIKKFHTLHQNKSNSEITKLLNEHLSSKITDIFIQWCTQEEHKISNYLENILQRFTMRMNEMIKNILNFSAKLFDLSIEVLADKESLVKETRFRFKLDREETSLSILVDSVTSILPRKFAHKIILKNASEDSAMLIDRHCGRLRYDFVERIKKTVKDYKSTLDQSLDIAKKNIYSILEIAENNTQNTVTETVSLEKQLNTKTTLLTQIKEELDNIKASAEMINSDISSNHSEDPVNNQGLLIMDKIEEA